MIHHPPTDRPRDVGDVLEGRFGPVDDPLVGLAERVAHFVEAGQPTGPVPRGVAQRLLALHGDLGAPSAAVASAGESAGPVTATTVVDTGGVRVERPTTGRVGDGPNPEPSVELCITSRPTTWRSTVTSSRRPPMCSIPSRNPSSLALLVRAERQGYLVLDLAEKPDEAHRLAEVAESYYA